MATFLKQIAHNQLLLSVCVVLTLIQKIAQCLLNDLIYCHFYIY